MPLSTSSRVAPSSAGELDARRSIQPATLPVRGSMRAMQLVMPDVGEHLALHPLQLVDVLHRPAVGGDGDAADLLQGHRIEEAQLRVPSLMISWRPSWSAPSPRPRRRTPQGAKVARS